MDSMQLRCHGRSAAIAVLAIGLVCLACSSGGSSDDAAGSGGDAGATVAKKCSFDKDNAAGLDRQAKLQLRQGLTAVDPKVPVIVNAASTSIGGPPIDTAFQISNVAVASSALELLVTKIETVAPAGESAFSCIAADNDGKIIKKNGVPVLCKDHTWGSVVPKDFEPACTSRTPVDAARFVIRYEKTDGALKTVEVRIKSDGDPDHTFVTFTVQTKLGKPAINVAPQFIDFDVVAPGAPAQTQPVAIQNTGEATLEISALSWPLQDKAFSVKIGEKTVTGDKDATFDPPIKVEPGSSVDAQVAFAPVDDKGRKATFTLASNAAGAATVQLQGNMNVPCLLVKPEKVLDHGLVYVGTESIKQVTLTNCGEGEVLIKSAKVADDSGAVFGLKAAKLPTEAQPIALAKNAKALLDISCTPPSENKDKAGVNQPFTAKLDLVDSTAKPNKTIALSCTGNAAKCPTPVIVPEPGEQIEPQMPLKLKGSVSYAAPPGKVVKYKWTLLESPPGAVGVKFFPNDTTADVQLGVPGTKPDGSPIVWLTVAGEYKVKLQVWDDSGTESCMPAVLSVLVVPSVAFHVELLWNTPEDTVQDDGPTAAGADLDLHVVHGKAYEAQQCSPTVTKNCQPDLDKDGKTDPWFNGVYDVYWINPSPKWGNAALQTDDPSLDLDDTNGWGPENMNLQLPENGVDYGVGVHYWDDHDFGASTATTRIYCMGALKAKFDQPMNECEMWWVTQVKWPSCDLADFPAANLKAPSAGKIVPKYWSLTSITLKACAK